METTQAVVSDGVRALPEIKVEGETYRRFLDMRAKANAATREVENLKKKLGLPDASTIASLYHFADTDKMELVIVNGNGLPCGKFTISHRAGYTVEPGWTGKAS